MTDTAMHQQAIGAPRRLDVSSDAAKARIRARYRAETRFRIYGMLALGFTALRVRHYDDTARIEVPLADLDRVVQLRAEVVEAVRSAGYRYVTLDLEGLRSGNLNAALR